MRIFVANFCFLLSFFTCGMWILFFYTFQSQTPCYRSQGWREILKIYIWSNIFIWYRHSRVGGNLNDTMRLKITWKIIPLWIFFFYNSYFPVAIPFLYPFFSNYCLFYFLKILRINQHDTVILCTKRIGIHMLLVLKKSLGEIGGDSSIQDSVFLICEYVNISSFFHNLFSEQDPLLQKPGDDGKRIRSIGKKPGDDGTKEIVYII